MKTYMTIDHLQALNIGNAHDHQTGCVVIDCSAWAEKYPALTVYAIFVTLPGGMIYCPVVEMTEAHELIWRITDDDTACPGVGQYQVVASGKYGDRRSSSTAELSIEANMRGMDFEEPPDASRPWVNKVLALMHRIEDAAQAAEKAAQTAVHQPIIGENGNWWLYDNTAGEYLDSGYPSRGE